MSGVYARCTVRFRSRRDTPDCRGTSTDVGNIRLRAALPTEMSRFGDPPSLRWRDRRTGRSDSAERHVRVIRRSSAVVARVQRGVDWRVRTRRGSCDQSSYIEIGTVGGPLSLRSGYRPYTPSRIQFCGFRVDVRHRLRAGAGTEDLNSPARTPLPAMYADRSSNPGRSRRRIPIGAGRRPSPVRTVKPTPHFGYNSLPCVMDRRHPVAMGSGSTGRTDRNGTPTRRPRRRRSRPRRRPCGR
jgi:hypothetical protein